MRQWSNLVMATLILTALFFGNCLSCPQVLAASSHRTGHGCCHHSTVKVDCHSQALSHFVKADGGKVFPALALTNSAPADAAAPKPQAALPQWLTPGAAPPDVLTLQSQLRV